MKVSIRQFEFEDIPNKIKWINDSSNNKYLHYDLPLRQNRTEKWFENNKDSSNRYDAIIEVDNKPIGIIGLLNIDHIKRQSEYYITIGESNYKGKSVAFEASKLILDYAFKNLNLQKVYLYTDQENIGMQKLAVRLGMIEEALLLDHSLRKNKFYNSFYYSIKVSDFEKKIKYPQKILSNIDFLEIDRNHNSIYMKRDDLISFSFGGNKARKAKYFFKEILEDEYKTVVTYGSKFSNHCRVVANMCRKHNLKCIIISPHGIDSVNINRQLIEMNNAEIIECEVEEVSDTINNILFRENDKFNNKTYFIPGGGHGNHGTQAYVDAYHEIEIWSRQNNKEFDYIFLASGTGTTQAGLILGNLIHNKKIEIVGFSVARKKEYGTSIILESILGYINNNNINIDNNDININFSDEYVTRIYGETNEDINQTIREVYEKFGIALNTSYTGKAFSGMKNYININNITEKNILFINTGGVPLFFDDLRKIYE